MASAFDNLTSSSDFPRISVVMATYNGADFLAEQLASVLQQTFKPIEVVVCDDGSSDGTVDILKRFQNCAPFPVHIFVNSVNLGFADNFLRAAGLASGDWISFCDQDDVWLPTKLREAADAIQVHKEAILILQNAFLTDLKLSVGRVFPNNIRCGFYEASSHYGFWVWPGFLQTFHASLLRDISANNRPISYYSGHNTQPHDKWTCMIANAIGGVVVIDKPAALYRRHAGAVTGDYRTQKVKERVSKAFRVSSEHYEFLATAARSTALYLREAAAVCKKSGWQEKMLIAANDFERLESIQLLRAEVYSLKSPLLRIDRFLRILFSGGYWGPRVIAMGGMSAAKDVAAVFGLLDRESGKSAL